MKNCSRNISLIICVLLVSFSKNISAQNAAQYDILEQLYFKANGPSWFNNTNWLDINVPVCDWYGITCNGSGEIIEIDLSNNNLSLSLSQSILNLHKLIILDVSGNDLTNVIPANNFPIFWPGIDIIDFSNNSIGFYHISDVFIDLNCVQGILNMDGNPCFCPNLTGPEICAGIQCEYLDIEITSGPPLVGENVELLATGGGNYQWDNGDVGPTASYFVDDFTLVAQVNSSFNGCQDSEIIRIRPEFNISFDVPSIKEVMLAFYLSLIHISEPTRPY